MTIEELRTILDQRHKSLEDEIKRKMHSRTASPNEVAQLQGRAMELQRIMGVMNG